MKKEIIITGYIVLNKETNEAISESNYYIDADLDKWHIYPTERSARAARTSSINGHHRTFNFNQEYFDKHILPLEVVPVTYKRNIEFTF